MIRQYSFEKLTVWQNSRKLVKSIYCSASALPADERFGLSSQIKRAVISVSSNIAEGASRTGPKDQAHFYQTAYASLMEVLCQMILCLDLGLIQEDVNKSTRESIDLVAYQLNQLRTSALSRVLQPSKPSQPSQPSKPFS